jgi:hypothetical protein
MRWALAGDLVGYGGDLLDLVGHVGYPRLRVSFTRQVDAKLLPNGQSHRDANSSKPKT